MDEDENNAVNRDELLQQFRDSLSKPMAERYFDEDALIDIFDYAGDLGDDYLRMEALMCGARFFPDSTELLQRRGIFYSQYSDRTRQQFLELSPQGDGMIFSLLSLRDNPPADKAELCQALDEIIDSTDEIEDEEIIQLVESVSELGAYAWAKDRYNYIFEKAAYKQGFVYEMAMLAESFADYAFSISLLEKLTEIDPFNSYYWMVLARQYAGVSNYEGAVSAIDYSLAINPKNAESLYLKGRLVYKMEHDFDKALSLCEQAMKLSNGNTDVVRFMASMHHEHHDDASAVSLLREVLNSPTLGFDAPFSDPSSNTSKAIELIPDMVLLGAEDTDQLLDRFFQANSDNSLQMWTTWASQLNAVGQRELAQKVIRAFERNSGQQTTSIITIEQDFLNGNYKAALEGINALTEDGEIFPSLYPSAMAMRLLVLIKEHKYREARMYAELLQHQSVDPEAFSVSQRLEFYALNDIVSRVAKLLDREPPMPDSFWDSYNPLCY